MHMSRPDDRRSSLPSWNGVAPVAVLDRVRRINRAVLNPVVSRFAGRVPGASVLIRHRGRASGRIYVTPLIAQRVDDGFVIPLTYGDRADWVKNVIADGRAQIRHQGIVYTVGKPVMLDEQTALPMLSPFLRVPVRWFGMKRFLYLTIASPPD
jgi:deazaflavin-dependent oxidoreductase (nitroreductase family)